METAKQEKANRTEMVDKFCDACEYIEQKFEEWTKEDTVMNKIDLMMGVLRVELMKDIIAEALRKRKF